MLKIEVGSVPMAFRTDSGRWLEKARRDYAGFKTSRFPELTFDLKWRQGADEPFQPRIEEAKGRTRIWRGDFDGKFDREGGELEVRRNPYSFNSFLRVLYTKILAERGGALFHAAGLAHGDDGYLFFGPSGYGKSTLTRLSGREDPELAALSDEVVLARRQGEGFKVYGTPFWGELARKGQGRVAHLRAAFSLKKSKRNKARRLGKAEAARRLLKTVLWFDQDRERTSAVLGTVEELVATTPVYELEFSKAGGFWPEVRACR